jgi:hypothetical protein
MNEWLAPAAWAAITIPSISMCGRLLHQLAVLERARLGLVGVADEVLVHVALGQERSLAPGGEAGAAATAQAGRLEFGDDLLRRHRERLAQCLVAAATLVDGDVARPGSSMSFISSWRLIASPPCA